MFESISSSLEAVFQKLRGRGRLTEKNIQDALREIRTALLEADVSYKVVRSFINNVAERSVGQDVIKSITPGQQIVKIVYDELVNLMGPVDHTIPFKEKDVTVIMLVGLQGSGKTTTAAKLAKMLEAKGHKTLLVAADVQRPAAIDQLKILGEQLAIPVYSEDGTKPPAICRRAVEYAAEQGKDVAILDTAGRLHIDEELMAELREIIAKVSPEQTYLVCDAMTGQDAVNSADEFNKQLALDGVILTKLDGDARGGAALSIKFITGKPIKFVGVGEKLDRLEEFHPDRMASRILGMGDVVSLVEKAQEAMEQEEQEKLAEKIQKSTLTLEDFLSQLQHIKNMGPLQELLTMIPGVGSKLPKDINIDGKEMKQVEAIIYSMTPDERNHPEIIDGNRRRRIARGSGTTTQDVNMLLKQFSQMKKMMKRFVGGQGGIPIPQGMPSGNLAGVTFRQRSRTKAKRKKKKRRRKRK